MKLKTKTIDGITFVSCKAIGVTIAYKVHGDTIDYGTALCNKSDKWNKSEGRHIASDRMEYNANVIPRVSDPESFFGEFIWNLSYFECADIN